MEEEATGDKTNLDYFKVWKEYEGVAMHFNDLLIRLRTQALGGVAVIAAIATVIAKGDIGFELKWGILLISFILLTIFWIAIWILDLRYYNRLLLGAVDAILELENESKEGKPINKIILSTRIEEIATGKKKIEPVQSSIMPVKYFISQSFAVY